MVFGLSFFGRPYLMLLLNSECEYVLHKRIAASRYLIVFGIMAFASVAPSMAIAQNDEGSTAGQCVIPDMKFWSLPESDSGAVPVNVELYLLDLVEINDKDGQFLPKFVMVLSWQDPRLKSLGGAGSDDVCITQLSEIWHPHFIFVNAAESVNNYDGLVEIHVDGRVVYSKPVTRRFTLNFDLRRFPFDDQILTVELASRLYGPDELTLLANESGTDIVDTANIQGWRLLNINVSTDRAIVTANSSYAAMEFSILVQRHSNFYFWRLFFPLLMITLMSWSVFWLEPTQLGSQIAVATGAVFSLMAFLVSLGEILPTVTYLSIADRIIVANMILIFVAFGESIVTGTLVQRNHTELARSYWTLGIPAARRGNFCDDSFVSGLI